MKTFRKLLALGLAVLLLASLTACGGLSAEQVRKSIDNSLRDNDPQRAVEIGRDWLSQNADDSYECLSLYEQVADILEQQLDDPEGASGLLREGWQTTGDSYLFNRYLERVLDDAVLASLPETFPSAEEIRLDGRPFSQWTEWELYRLLPRTESLYESGDYGSGDWYLADEYRNAGIRTTCYIYSDDRRELSVEYSSLGSYRNYYDRDFPEPELPLGIQPGDGFETLMDKLGIPEELRPYLEESSYSTFEVSDRNAEIWLSPLEQDGEFYGRTLTIEYDTRDYYGSLSFSLDEDDVLDGYEMSNREAV